MQQVLTQNRIGDNKAANKNTNKHVPEILNQGNESIKIIAMLYDGAISFINIAKKRLQQNDMAGKSLYLAKTTAIVGELSSSLNMEDGGEVAGNLRRLYDYVLDRLLAANTNNDPAIFDEVEKILDTLRSAWQEIEKTEAVAA
jgi:flagellar protein FliS